MSKSYQLISCWYRTLIPIRMAEICGHACLSILPHKAFGELQGREPLTGAIGSLKNCRRSLLAGTNVRKSAAVAHHSSSPAHLADLRDKHASGCHNSCQSGHHPPELTLLSCVLDMDGAEA